MMNNIFNVFGNMATTRGTAIAGISIATLLLLAPMAFAASPRITNGSGNTQESDCHIVNPPTNFDLECTGTISGVGGNPPTAHLEASVSASGKCFNGGNDPGPVPGQSGTVTSVGQSVPLPTPQNGKTNFDLTAPAPSIVPHNSGNNWHCTITQITYTNPVVVLETVSGDFRLALTTECTTSSPCTFP